LLFQGLLLIFEPGNRQVVTTQISVGNIRGDAQSFTVIIKDTNIKRLINLNFKYRLIKKIIGLFLLFTISEFGFPTGQVPDYLIINKDTIAIFSNPLKQYFELTGKRELIDFVGCGSTACWRGYKAYWELKNDSLFLIRITSCHKDCGLEIQDANLEKMFGTNEVFAYWFNGEIIAPQGKLVQYIHMGYASIYEREQIFTFKNGKKIKVKIKSNKKLVDKIEFQNKEKEIAILVQDTLFYYMTKHVSWDTLVTPYYMLCDEKYILTYNKRGKIKKAWVDWEGATFREKIDDWWWNNTDDRKCRMTIKKAIKPLRLSYIDLPKRSFKITFEVFYDRKTGKLELWKEYWIENEL
jgi:hypothetical protein